MTEQQTAPPRDSAGGRVVLIVVLALLVLVGGAWVAAYAFSGDRIPRGTTVSGVEIGGKTSDQAVRALREGLADRDADPIVLTADGEAWDFTPAELGLAIDHEESVARAGGERSWDPRRLWDHYTDGHELDAVVTVDEAAVADALEQVEAEAGTPARDGDVRFRQGRIKTIEPRVGEGVDGEAAREAVEAAYLSEDRTVELPLEELQPEIDEADVQEALDEFANPAVSGPVTLVFDETPVELTPAEFSPVLRMRAEDGELVPDLKQDALAELVGDAVGDDGAPVDATVRLVGGKPEVVPAKPGVSYDPEQVRDTFLDLVTRTDGERRLEVEATVARPEFTTKEARDLGIVEQVSTFTTYYPHAEYRNVNIGRAAEIIDGTVLKPGETFSLNDTVGERTRENGFTEGFVISDGILKEDLGGGVSQMATTLFNAMFFAGLEDVEHKPHSFYIDRYPVGREATVAWGAIDLRFRNDTDYGVLIDTNVTPSTPSSPGVVTATFYSTKVWDIESTTSDRYAYTEPETRTLRTEDCYAYEGSPGFQVDVTRIFRRAGQQEVERREKFHTVYTPSDGVVCR
ncbi:VanW family protein [Nocardioides sp. SYSU DS0663]|uniref:VanW family protein n=1 Tax=Nocardioides sp. SYSU DS0663 TaxID=3416445 RepID=UPI003F4C625E